MTIKEIIELSKNAKMPDKRFQNTNIITDKYSIRDMMDGTLMLRYYSGPVRQWIWKAISMKHCPECSKPSFVMGTGKQANGNSFCNGKCSKLYHHRQLKPIEYNGKIYTLKDCSKYEIKTYLNPIKVHINSIKGLEKRMEDPEYAKKIRNKQAIRSAEYRTLHPLSEEQRLQANKANNDRYHANREKFLARAKIAKANWTLEQKKHERKRKQKWEKQDKINNPMKYRIKSVIQSVFARFGKKKINRTISYGIDVKAIAKHLSKLAKNVGKTFKWMHENEYDIDHIISISWYNHNDEDDFRNCNSHFNLRWLSSFENRSRGDKLRPEDIAIIRTLPKKIYPKAWNGKIPTDIN